MIRRTTALLLGLAALAGCSVGGAEDTHTFVREKSAKQVVIGIHISLLNHPKETHALGYAKMQNLAQTTCQEFGKSTATYTGQQNNRTLGNSYDSWIERSYRCS